MILMDGLTGGNNEYGAMLVAINSMLEMDLSAPIAILYLRVITGADKTVSYELVSKSVVTFLGNPVAAAVITQFPLRKLASPS